MVTFVFQAMKTATFSSKKKKNLIRWVSEFQTVILHSCLDRLVLRKHQGSWFPKKWGGNKQDEGVDLSDPPPLWRALDTKDSLLQARREESLETWLTCQGLDMEEIILNVGFHPTGPKREQRIRKKSSPVRSDYFILSSHISNQTVKKNLKRFHTDEGIKQQTLDFSPKWIKKSSAVSDSWNKRFSFSHKI